MDRAVPERWIAEYVRLWRQGPSAGEDQLAALFTPDATYRHHPLQPPVRGLPAIAAWWGTEIADGERWDLTSEVVAIDGHTAVARLDVSYSAPEPVRYLDIWIMRFAPDGRCAAFEEWWWRDPPSPR